MFSYHKDFNLNNCRTGSRMYKQFRTGGTQETPLSSSFAQRNSEGPLPEPAGRYLLHRNLAPVNSIATRVPL